MAGSIPGDAGMKANPAAKHANPADDRCEEWLGGKPSSFPRGAHPATGTKGLLECLGQLQPEPHGDQRHLLFLTWVILSR